MTQAPALTFRALSEMLLLAAIWGASFLSIKLALDELPVLTLVAHRVAWAALILWAYVLIRGLPVPRAPRVWGALIVMGLLNNAIPFALMAWGQQYIETGLTSIFNAGTAVFGVLVAAAVFADERLTARRLAGVLIAFAGVAVAIGLEALAQFDIRSAAQLAVLLGALSYAVAAAWARKHLSGLPPQIAAMGMLTGSSLILLPLAYVVDGGITLPHTTQGIGAVAYFAVLGTALAYLLYYRVLAVAGSGNAMLVTLMIPPVAITLGWLVLDERLAPSVFVGFGLLAVGLLLLNPPAALVRALGRPRAADPSS